MGGWDAEFFFELLSAAIGANGALLAANKELEIVLTPLAGVFVDRHRN
jgi:hypothetical protein